MRCPFVLLLSLVGAAIAGAPLAAQAMLTGFVRGDSTGRPIWNADVVVDGGGSRARSGVDGRFILRDLVAGRHTVLARAIGYKPLALEVDLAAHDTLEVELALTRFVQRLAAVEVEGRVDLPKSGKMEEFERRRATGFGKFLDRTELAKWDPLPVSAALRRLAGVQLRARPASCGGGFAAATSRGGETLIPSCDPLIRYQGCFLTVFLDGARIYTPPDPDPPNVDDLLASGLQAVEVYGGPGEMPAELSGTGTPCGAIVFWTRTGEPENR